MPATPPDPVIASVRITHPERVLYPEMGLTKCELAEYYAGIASRILPHVARRPLSVVRCPRGRDRACFYQKHRGAGFDPAVGGIEVEEKGGTVATYLMVRDAAGVVALVQAGALELHPWGSRGDRLERPDRLILDLDPGPGVGWPAVIEAARALGERLDALGLTSFVRTTGGKGLHVVAPLVRRASWDRLKRFAHALAESLVASAPDRYTATAAQSERAGRIFIDWLRNARGATAVACYSTRARPGAPVATPVRWEELATLGSSAAYTVTTLPAPHAALPTSPPSPPASPPSPPTPGRASSPSASRSPAPWNEPSASPDSDPAEASGAGWTSSLTLSRGGWAGPG
jgi:bifunctional non-homologous end joining protein LigD